MPFPPDYGGVQDVFFKIVALHSAGVEVILHCFEYGRSPAPILETYCKEVHYYKRKTGFFEHLHVTPYIIQSRKSKELLDRLLKDDFQILFEGLHTCSIINHPLLNGRIKIYRESNIEHDYYRGLFRSAVTLKERLFYLVESVKLKIFEKKLKHAQIMLAVTLSDRNHLKVRFPNSKVEYLASFHPYDEVNISKGKGSYILFHGNLEVPENFHALEFLLDKVFKEIRYPIIVAGKMNSDRIERRLARLPNIRLISNPSMEKMAELITGAQVHCLFTKQATGLKLKLLNVLFLGRFVICNAEMLSGTPFRELCVIAETPAEFIKKLHICMAEDFTEELISKRKLKLEDFTNRAKIKEMIDIIF